MVKKLIDELSYDSIKLSQALTRANIIATTIKNETLTEWLTKELEGYQPDDPTLPSFRKIVAPAEITYEAANGERRSFPLNVSPNANEMLIDFAKHHQIRDSIAIIEKMLQNLDGTTCYLKLPNEFVRWVSDEIKSNPRLHGFTVVGVGREISLSQLQQVIELTKQKLLSILLQIDTEFPNMSNEFSKSKEDTKRLEAIVTNNVYGNNNVLIAAAGERVDQKDITISIQPADIEALKEFGVDENQIVELQEIMNTKQKETIGNKMMKWISSVSATLVTKGLTENLPAIIEFVQKHSPF